MDNYLAGLATEQVNEETAQIDTCSTLEMVQMINRQDAIAAEAVAKEAGHIAEAIDRISEGMKKGGHLIYIGAGTSGRLGVLDASECPPTFGVEETLVQGFIAGGDRALRHAIEGGEDQAEDGIRLIQSLHLTSNDSVVGISASGSARYVLAAMEEAKKEGAFVVGLATNPGSKMEAIADVCIAPAVGPEVISGSTRMKSGTAQKMVLNMLSTGCMVRLGKVYGNLMVDLKASNIKLKDRAVRLVGKGAGVPEDAACTALQEADLDVKLAILMLKTGLEKEAAKARLAKAQGHLREAIENH